MKTIKLILFTMLLSLYAKSQSDGVINDAGGWTSLPDLPGVSRTSAAGFAIGNKIYIGTGIGSSNEMLNDFWEYDPAANVWTQKADVPGPPRLETIGFSINGKGYIGMGSDGDSHEFFNDMWEYDPVTDTWNEKAPFPGNGRIHQVTFVIGNKAYVVAGVDWGFGFYADSWEFDPVANTWTQKADFGGGGRSDAFSFSINDKGYVGTGYLFGWQKDFYQYDPSSNTWTRMKDFPGHARENAGGFSINGKGYMGTGYYAGQLYKDFWEYDPANDLWIQQEDFPGGTRNGTLAIATGDKGYMGFGGNGSSLYKDFWVYTPGESNCPAPTNPVVKNVTKYRVRLAWTPTGSGISGFEIRYRPTGSYYMKTRLVRPIADHVILFNLLPGTTYKWRIRSLCDGGHTAWVQGPDFKTLSVETIASAQAEDMKINTVTAINVLPNPTNGNFNVQLQLAGLPSSTNLALYNAFGQQVWYNDLGNIAGSKTINVSLSNKLSPGTYLLKLYHNGLQYTKQVMIMK